VQNFSEREDMLGFAMPNQQHADYTRTCNLASFININM